MAGRKWLIAEITGRYSNLETFPQIPLFVINNGSATTNID
ncbi:hypothetical protein HMPREF0880_00224 [Yokenella regensburgei ATCC 43003]|nr:hypothetical protein HMPREF0880_00224 [Yokenella regensburgei ATCC 43003]